MLCALTCSSEASEDFSGCILSDVQRQLTFYPMISQTLRGAGLSPRSEVQTAFLTATHDVTCSTFRRKYVREGVKFKKMIEFLCVPCCWAGPQPHSRASPVSLPVQSSWLFVWSSVSKPGGPSHRVQECVSWALWLWKHMFFLTSSRHMHSFLGSNGHFVPFFFLRGTLTTSFLLLFLFCPFPPTTRWFLDAGSIPT